MPDFKGRKDFPEVADAKIKIGDYSGNNRLAVTDIYSPKPEPELRDQIMEPRKGKPNNYDSPVLSQQPVITLSDMDAEAALIRAIGGYVEKQAVGKAVRGSEQNPGAAVQGPLAPAGGGAGGHDAAPEKKPAWTGNAGSWRQDKAPTSPAAGGAPAQNTAAKPPIAGTGGGTRSASTALGRTAPPPKKAGWGMPGMGGGAEAPGRAFASAAKPAAAGRNFMPGMGGGAEAPGRAFAPAAQNTAQKPPTRPPANSGDGYTAEQQRNAMNPRNTVTIPQTPRQPAGGGGAPQKTTPGPGFDEGRGKRGKKGRGVGGFFGDLAGAAKVGVQQGIRSGKEGAYEEGAEADERRGVQRGKTNKNRSTRVASSIARGASKLPGMRGGAKAMGFGRTKAEEDAMRTRMEYAGNEEMALSDILNELDSYIANKQPNNSMVERQMTKGNISKMMRNTEEKAPRDWKYHV